MPVGGSKLIEADHDSHWLNNWLTDWLSDLLVIDWVTDWVIDGVFELVTDWLIEWMIECFMSDWLSDERVIDWWLIVTACWIAWLIHWMKNAWLLMEWLTWIAFFKPDIMIAWLLIDWLIHFNCFLQTRRVCRSVRRSFPMRRKKRRAPRKSCTTMSVEWTSIAQRYSAFYSFSACILVPWVSLTFLVKRCKGNGN